MMLSSMSPKVKKADFTFNLKTQLENKFVQWTRQLEHVLYLSFSLQFIAGLSISYPNILYQINLPNIFLLLSFPSTT